MAFFQPNDLLNSLRGKVCGHSDLYYVEKYGTKYTAKICHPRTAPYSASELALQDKFRTVTASTLTALADPTERAKYEAAFRKQKRYKTLRGYTFAQLYHQTAGN